MAPAIMIAPLRAGLALAALSLFPSARGEEPACDPRPSWPRTMWEGREAFLAASEPSDFEPLISEVMRGGEEARHIVVDVGGLDRLWLIAEGVPDNRHAQSTWAAPILRTDKGGVIRLSDLEPIHVEVGWGSFLRNRSIGGQPLRIGSRRFEHGLLPHADSAVGYEIDGLYSSFEAWIGVEADAATRGAVRFTVTDRPGEESRLRSLVEEIAADHPERSRLTRRLGAAWFRAGARLDVEAEVLEELIAGLGQGAGSFPERWRRLAAVEGAEGGLRRLELLEEAASLDAAFASAEERILLVDPPALERAIRDLRRRFPASYDPGSEYLDRLPAIERSLPEVTAGVRERRIEALERARGILAFQREVLLADPTIDFERLLLLVRRVAGARGDLAGAESGLPANWQGNSVLPKRGWDNRIAVMELRDPGAPLETVWRPEDGAFVGDVDLHFDGERLLFSSIGTHDRWQVFEIGVDGAGLRQLTRGEEPDVDSYDACYLPDGGVVFASTAVRQGVPCVNGTCSVANLFRMDSDGGSVRRLCFDQDDDWSPVVLEDGRVMYQRWEYADLPHSNSRILFHMNPDGTGQTAYYGSNSFWPNSLFYARPVPGGRFVGIVSGHHGLRRMGELVLFDPSLGRHEAEGAIQRIPGWGEEVEAVVLDNLVDGSWPRFLHPFPLGESSFLVSAKPTPESRWGIYLVDVFDNLLLLAEMEGCVLFEPIPLRPSARPPVLPRRTDPSRSDALISIADVYLGPGLAGIPRGTVKELRLFSYTWLYDGCGVGRAGSLGLDGPWDVKRVLGTVPVEEDGSAFFRVPASTPISVQPLDEDGKALQIMRSWLTAMPGESLSCVGCHEDAKQSAPLNRPRAFARAPSEIEPWYGPPRGFTFEREVQPVLTRRCAGCHDGGEGAPPDLSGADRIADWSTRYAGYDPRPWAGQFSTAYVELQRFVRRPGIESDMHLWNPMEFHADTTELAQMLERGHHGVELDREERERLITWIDLNAPFHGYWSDVVGESARRAEERRAELRLRTSGRDENHEVRPAEARLPLEPVLPEIVPAAEPTGSPEVAGWPFDSEAAAELQGRAGAFRRTFELGEGIALELVRIPAGAFVAGDSTDGPVRAATIGEPFWMGTCEITNRQYALFDPTHDSGVEPRHSYQFGIAGYPLNRPDQPAVRVSLEEARAFCAWLGAGFRLPTEAEWEWACRAGTETAFFHGDLDADFSRHANFADARLSQLVQETYIQLRVVENPTPYDDWIPKDPRFDDGGMVSLEVGSYRPNAWGLHDMHGNAAEWTTTRCPWDERKVVVRGGSWYDRPKRGTSSFRLAHRPYQKVFNVGFRVVCDPQ